MTLLKICNSSRYPKTRFILIWHCKRQRKIRCLEQDSLSRAGLKCEFKSRSRQRIFRCRLQCQINMNLVFHISEDGSEIESVSKLVNSPHPNSSAPSVQSDSPSHLKKSGSHMPSQRNSFFEQVSRLPDKTKYYRVLCEMIGLNMHTNRIHYLKKLALQSRGETRALIGGGGVNIHIFVFCPTNFFWN